MNILSIIIGLALSLATLLTPIRKSGCKGSYEEMIADRNSVRDRMPIAPDEEAYSYTTTATPGGMEFCWYYLPNQQ